MSALKRLLVLMALLLMVLPFRLLQAQDTEPEPDIDTAIAEWEAMEAEAWTWDTCCLHMEERAAEYEADLAAGLTEAESMAEWCVEQRAAAFAETCAAWRNVQTRAGHAEIAAADDESLALKCSCVCQISSEERCALCLEDPADPALLEIPGVCHCIVAH